MNTGPIVVEQQGSHHVAWMRAENGQAHRSVLMVGQTAEEAEARLKAWFAAHAGILSTQVDSGASPPR